MGKPKILVIQDYFLPAYKGGGSLRTVVNIIDRLFSDFDFDVICRDRDQGDIALFGGLEPGAGTDLGSVPGSYANSCYE